MTTTEPAHPPLSSGYSELVREIRGQGLLHRRPRYYLTLGAVNLFCLMAVVAGLVLLRDWWWTILLAPVLAVVSTQIAFLSHDTAHSQVCRGRTRTVLCLVQGNLLSGLSYGWWVDKHNAHHAHPNDLESDPDVAVGALVFDSGQAGTRMGMAAWTTRHQAALFFPMLTLEAFNLHISSARAVLHPGLGRRWIEGLLLLAHAAMYVTLLVTTMTWAQALVFVVIHQSLFGVYLGCSFAPSHKGMPTLTPEEDADPLLRQVLSSRNILGGRFVDLAMGGLNLQIEHHLFPSMPRPNLRRAQPIVERHCRARGIPYAESTLLGSYGLALQHLHRVGAPLRAQVDDR